MEEVVTGTADTTRPPRKENRLNREKAGGRQPFPLTREDTKAHRGTVTSPGASKPWEEEVAGKGGKHTARAQLQEFTLQRMPIFL